MHILQLNIIYILLLFVFKALSMQASPCFILITLITLNQICIGHSADISDIRRLRIRAALSDPVEESCKGSLDYSGFSKLDKICKDCFNLIREPEIYQLCRYNRCMLIIFEFDFLFYFFIISFFYLFNFYVSFINFQSGLFLQ